MEQKRLRDKANRLLGIANDGVCKHLKYVFESYAKIISVYTISFELVSIKQAIQLVG